MLCYCIVFRFLIIYFFFSFTTGFVFFFLQLIDSWARWSELMQFSFFGLIRLNELFKVA